MPLSPIANDASVLYTLRRFTRYMGSTFADKKDFMAVLDMLTTIDCKASGGTALTVINGGLNDCLFASQMLKLCPGLTIHGFEVARGNADSCRIALSAYRGARVHNQGMSRGRGTAHLIFDCASDKSCSNSSQGGAMTGIVLGELQKQQKQSSGTEVPTVGLLQFAEQQQLQRAHFTLIDTEGHEPEVLRGMHLRRALGPATFGAIQFEISGFWIDPARRAWRSNSSQLAAAWFTQANHLDRAGYRLFMIGGTSRCKVTSHDHYSCRGKATYLPVTPGFFEQLGPIYERHSKGRLFQGGQTRVGFPPTFNVLAMHTRHADPAIQVFVQSRVMSL